jgi:hypothetical protein
MRLAGHAGERVLETEARLLRDVAATRFIKHSVRAQN